MDDTEDSADSEWPQEGRVKQMHKAQEENLNKLRLRKPKIAQIASQMKDKTQRKYGKHTYKQFLQHSNCKLKHSRAFA